MIGVAVLGATGRTGRHVVAQVIAHPELELSLALSSSTSAWIGADAGTLAGVQSVGVPVRALETEHLDHSAIDVVIDFSTPQALERLLPVLGARALVTGTTGLDAVQIAARSEQAHCGPVLAAANFSTGITVLLDLARRAATALPGYDVEIIEAHHRHKVDAPSGTALALGDAVCAASASSLAERIQHGRSGAAGPRSHHEVGMHAVRGGGIVGEHQLWLVGDGERVSLGHAAFDRSAFARGAVRASEWLHGRPPGSYTMAQMLGLTSP